MKEIIHYDKLGRPIAVNDYVAYPYFNSLEFGKVMKLNNIMIGVLPLNSNSSRNTNKYPADIVRLDPAEMTWYLLKNTK